MCAFIDKNKGKKKLTLIPRGHLKSTVVTVGRSTQAIVTDPTTRVLMGNATYALACSFLTEIKRHLNREFHKLKPSPRRHFRRRLYERAIFDFDSNLKQSGKAWPYPIVSPEKRRRLLEKYGSKNSEFGARYGFSEKIII